jgi:hypothetical protein
MTSLKQIEANRRNALKSTGPVPHGHIPSERPQIAPHSCPSGQLCR